jgi:zinc transport system substrate-binding protein
MIRRRLAWGLLLVSSLGILFGMDGCRRAPDPWEGLDGGDRKRVVVSFPPLYSFVKGVGGDHVAVICLCNTGPHDFNPGVTKSLVFHKADVLFSIGLGLDSYADNLVNSSDNKQLRHVHLGNDLPKDILIEGGEDKDTNDKDKDSHDPHVWLGTHEAVLMVNRIRDELTTLDPAHKDAYTTNAGNYVKKLEELQSESEKRLQDKKNRQIVSSHDALRYFQRTYHLEVIPIVETPEDPTSAQKLAALGREISAKDIRVIAIEPGDEKARKSADALLGAIKDDKVREHIKIIEFDPLETAEEKELTTEAGDWYLKRMRQNLDTLIEVLP